MVIFINSLLSVLLCSGHQCARVRHHLLGDDDVRHHHSPAAVAVYLQSVERFFNGNTGIDHFGVLVPLTGDHGAARETANGNEHVKFWIDYVCSVRWVGIVAVKWDAGEVRCGGGVGDPERRGGMEGVRGRSGCARRDGEREGSVHVLPTVRVVGNVVEKGHLALEERLYLLESGAGVVGLDFGYPLLDFGWWSDFVELKGDHR